MMKNTETTAMNKATRIKEVTIGLNKYLGTTLLRLSELNGEYRVIVYWPAGMQNFPDCHRFNTRDAAEAKFTALYERN